MTQDQNQEQNQNQIEELFTALMPKKIQERLDKISESGNPISPNEFFRKTIYMAMELTAAMAEGKQVYVGEKGDPKFKRYEFEWKGKKE